VPGWNAWEVRNPGKCELGFGMGVTHWHAGGNCGADSSADRRAVRIAKGYLRFITDGVPDRDEDRQQSRLRNPAEQVGGGIPVRRARLH